MLLPAPASLGFGAARSCKKLEVRTMFTLYLVATTVGLVAYLVVGLTS
jgi:hypothetical protein